VSASRLLLAGAGEVCRRRSESVRHSQQAAWRTCSGSWSGAQWEDMPSGCCGPTPVGCPVPGSELLLSTWRTECFENYFIKAAGSR
jgi:hypothetical protein